MIRAIENISSKVNNGKSDLSSFTTNQNEEDDLKELSLDKIYEMASNGIFKKKLFIFKNSQKMYCERMHFFESIRKFNLDLEDCKEENVTFTCKICQQKINCPIGQSTNLNQHLKIHEQFRSKWLKFFDQKNNHSGILDSDTLDLIKGIISANIALSQLENEIFARCLKMELTSVRTFRYDRLPRAYELMKDFINKKLDEALTISFITDIWTNKIIADFLALAAILVNKFYQYEFLVMTSMSGSHTAENIKIVLEEIINSYSFNKNLAHGNYI